MGLCTLVVNKNKCTFPTAISMCWIGRQRNDTYYSPACKAVIFYNSTEINISFCETIRV